MEKMIINRFNRIDRRWTLTTIVFGVALYFGVQKIREVENRISALEKGNDTIDV